jgi:hypothetical protein
MIGASWFFANNLESAQGSFMTAAALSRLLTNMQVSKDELIDGSKGSYRHAYCPAESMDQLLSVW